MYADDAIIHRHGIDATDSDIVSPLDFAVLEISCNDSISRPGEHSFIVSGWVGSGRRVDFFLPLEFSRF
ncbi:hypothetical protein A6E15_03035 [Natrinema saccharevitans]|uniref:Uncharacterized protein n=1 Tax=Natrinema saccharevitans TaxID=301967 RepID=A0A1S8ATH2_9EURY|nr:hypothetical protein A6E15_03035 [Natrinema saccharevitans]